MGYYQKTSLIASLFTVYFPTNEPPQMLWGITDI